MKIGIFSDPHITKKVHEFTTEWESSVVNSFSKMYETFNENRVDIVVCSGDFFDKATLEARSVPLINEVRSIMDIKTFVLLGNHEIDSDKHNILDAFDYGDDLFCPVTSLSEYLGLLFIPYNVDLETLDKSEFKNRIIFTHHDIYGSTLAGGKVRASFGYDPNMFNDAEIVFNGHIHLRSKLGKVMNVGSLLTTQFGEVSDDSVDFPRYYIYDTETKELTDYVNKETLYYLTLDYDKVDELSSDNYKDLNVLLRLNYTNEEDINDITLPDNVLKVVRRKLMENKLQDDTPIIKSSHIDIKSMISSYIDDDDTVSDSDKVRLRDKCLDMLGG